MITVYLHLATFNLSSQCWEYTINTSVSMVEIPHVDQYIQMGKVAVNQLALKILSNTGKAYFYRNWFYREEGDDTIFLDLCNDIDLRIKEVKWIANAQDIYEPHILLVPPEHTNHLCFKVSEELTEENLSYLRKTYSI